MKNRKLKILIVGAGDVARRLTTRIGLNERARWRGLARSADTAQALRVAGILPVRGDLDVRVSLARAGALARDADAVLYLAPPPGEGLDDPRMKRWLAEVAKPVRKRRVQRSQRVRRAVSAESTRPRRVARPLRNVYTSTTGVYGDCAGERIDETRRCRPFNDRAKRRVAAERRLRQVRDRRFAILRAPGIYAAERLPVDRLRAGTPALVKDEDVFTNHIHADDLALALWLALFRAGANRVLNVVDQSEIRMADYFDQVAAAVSLPRPPRVSRVDLARSVSPMLYSFMSESRRIDNKRVTRELRLRLQYPTPADFLRRMKPAAALQRSLL